MNENLVHLLVKGNANALEQPMWGMKHNLHECPLSLESGRSKHSTRMSA